jgi:hypothetical protein
MFIITKESKAISMISFDEIVFNIAVKIVKYSFFACTRMAFNNPRVALLALALYFRKDIIHTMKDATGYIAGEYPYMSLLVILGYLSYYRYTHAYMQADTKQNNGEDK